MSVYAISDLHLSTNEETNKSMEVFGARWNCYTEKIERNWNKLVSENDTVIIPGDISWAMTLEEALSDLKLLDRLPGKKIIGKGNHDFWWSTQAKIDAFFEKNNIKSIRCLHNNAFEVEDIMICGSRGWFNDEKSNNIPSNTDYNKIVSRETMRIKRSLEMADSINAEKEKVVFLHFPPIFKDFRCDEIESVLKSYNVKRCFFGHIHGVYDLPRSFENNGITYSIISADYLGFTPQLVPNSF